MKSSVVRNLGAPTPSLREEAAVRRQNAAVAAWGAGGLLVVGLLLKVSATMVGEVYGVLFAGGVSPLTTAAQPGDIVLSNVDITSDKLLSVVGDAAAGLEMWKDVPLRGKGPGETMVASAARHLVANCDSLQTSLLGLQESLAKSTSVGSVVGLRSVDLEKVQKTLQQDQASVAKKMGEVHKTARRLLEEHQEYEQLVAPSTESTMVASPESDRKRKAVTDSFWDALDKTDMPAAWERLREVERKVYGAVDRTEAEEVASRVISNAALASSEGGISDEEIALIVEELVPPVGKPVPSDGCVSMAAATDLTRSQLEIYAADRTGIPDYAMGPAGANVMTKFTTKTYEPHLSLWQKMLSRTRKQQLQPVSEAHMAINPESHPGMCWPMEGSVGKLVVKLSQPIEVNQVSLEHAPRELLLNGGMSAPKDFSVLGYRKGAVVTENAASDTLVSGARYLLEGDDIQFFAVAEEFYGVEYGTLSLQIETNHGHAEYTCLYRFRVHGTPSLDSSL